VLLNAGSSIGISQQPADQRVNAGQTAVFSVVAAGATSFQWRHNGTPLVNGGHFSGVNTDTLTVSNVTTVEAGVYDVQLVGACNSGQFSNAATLSVCVVAGDFNDDNTLNSSDIQGFVEALLAG